VSSHEVKWTILTKITLQNISIDPITKALPLESPQETSQTKNQFQNLMHERLYVNHFSPLSFLRPLKAENTAQRGMWGIMRNHTKLA